MKRRKIFKNHKKNSKLKQFVAIFACIVLVIDAVIVVAFKTSLVSAQSEGDPTVQTVAAKPVSSTISADGAITAQNQVTLHFQTGGKLISLPFKEGDKIAQGQTVAQLDTYALQRQVQIAANSYMTAKNAADQNVEGEKAGVFDGQQRTTLDTTNKNGYSVIPETTYIYDTIERMVNNSLLSQNTAQLNIDLANYAIQLATLTSPISGIVTKEDVDVAGVNVGPTTGFTVADPNSIVFRANVSESDIDYVTEGSQAAIRVDGQQTGVTGTVVKIYPSKITLPSGGSAYQVDIQSDQIKPTSKLDQSGTALIQTNAQSNVLLVPSWTVLGGKYIWVKENNNPVLKTITTGKTHGDMIEVIEGLVDGDKVIVDPKFLSKQKYQLL
jgi:RND family efflux transporter MFP subunit